MKIFFSKIATTSNESNWDENILKTIIYFSIYYIICDVCINVNIYPYTTLMLDRHLGQIELQSFIVLYGVKADKK